MSISLFPTKQSKEIFHHSLGTAVALAAVTVVAVLLELARHWLHGQFHDSALIVYFGGICDFIYAVDVITIGGAAALFSAAFLYRLAQSLFLS